MAAFLSRKRNNADDTARRELVSAILILLVVSLQETSKRREMTEEDKYTPNVNGDVGASLRLCSCRVECEEDYQNKSTVRA